MTVPGVDISHWQDDPETPIEIDFQRMYASGARFVIFKVTEGVRFFDWVFDNSWDDASNLIRGAYHWLRWDCDPEAQANWYCDHIKDHALDFPPIVDFEDRKGVPDNTTTRQWLWAWVTRVEDRTGRVPMIYTGPSYWTEFGSRDRIWSRYPLWLAHYKVEIPTVPKPWPFYTLWQYTSKGNGPLYGVESKSIDLDLYHGTIDQLRAFVGIPIPPVAEPTDAEKLARLWKAHPELGQP